MNSNDNSLCVKTTDLHFINTNSSNNLEVPEIPGLIKLDLDNKLKVYGNGNWNELNMPLSDNNGYDELEKFIHNLSVRQLQDIYKHKNDLLILIEKCLLGKV